jgi:hypothetical protein
MQDWVGWYGGISTYGMHIGYLDRCACAETSMNLNALACLNDKVENRANTHGEKLM